MPLTGTCPACGYSFALEQALTDTEARQALAAALAVPPQIGQRVVRYMGLHAPAGRRIQWPKLTRLLQELTERLHSAQVSRHGVTHAAPLEIWAKALDQVLAKRDAGTLNLPLNGHGLLDTICFDLAAKAARPHPPGLSPEALARGETPEASHPSHRPADLPKPRPRRHGRAAAGGLKSLGEILKGRGG